jgi:ATP-dependent phosphofructokinase / diphosphate-dependent phosphofructokinase
VDLIARGEFGKMVSLRGTKICSVDIAEACGAIKRVDPEGNVVHTARSVGISFGD